MKPLRELSAEQIAAISDDEIIELVVNDIEAFHAGGPDLEAEHPRLAPWAEETIREGWRNARIKRQPIPAPKPAKPTLAPQTPAGSSVSGSYFRDRLIKSRPKDQVQSQPGTGQSQPSVGSKFDAVVAELSAVADANEAKGVQYAQDDEPEEEIVAPKRNLPALIPSRQLATWSDAIAAMNEQHAVIENVGNKAVIASWEPSPTNLDRRMLVFQGKDSFLLRHSNRSVSIEVSDGRGGMRFDRAPLGQWWLGHRDRRQHRGVTFRPGADEVVSECLNMWQGWGVVPKAGDWGLILWHIKEVIAGGNVEFANYVIRWIAWSVQNPAAQAEVALVLIGHKGAGKGTLVRCLQRIFGAHAFQVTSREEVIGKFNGHLQDCVLFVADEAYWGGDKRCVGRLQGMITEPTLPIERKGFDLILVPNYLHVVMLAEPGWVIPAGRYERRYAALSVSDVRRGDREYFKALHRQIADDGAEAMMWDLQRLELDGWHPREIPESLLKGSALQEQQAHTLPPLEQWYLSLLQDGRVPGALIAKPTSKKISRPNTAYTKSLREDAIQRFPRLRFELSDSGIADFMTDKSWLKAKKYRDSKGNGWAFEPLIESRAAFDQRYGPQVWCSDAKDWGDVEG